MIKIDYQTQGDIFVVSIDTKQTEFELFEYYVRLFKSLHLTYSAKTWTLPGSKIHMLIEWMKYCSYKFYFTNTANAILLLNPWYQSETKFSRISFDKSILNSKYKLIDYQEKGVNFFLRRSRSFNSDATGLGKSLMSTSICSTWYHKEMIDSLIILVPSGILYDWEYNILDYVTLFNEKDIRIITNENKYNIFQENTDKKILIIPHHLFAEAMLLNEMKKIKGSLKNLHWNRHRIDINSLWKKNSVGLLIDEAHAIKNSKAIISKCLETNINQFEYRHFMTATPAIIRPEDIYNQMRLLDKSIFPMCEEAFKVYIAKDIGDKYNNMYGIVEYNSDNLLEMYQRTKTHLLKRIKKSKNEINKLDIPHDGIIEMKAERFIIPKYFNMSDTQRNMYQYLFEEDIKKSHIIDDKIKSKSVFSKFPFAIQCEENPALLLNKLDDDKVNKYAEKWTLDKDCRINFLDQYLDECINDLKEKVIIYDIHPKTIDMLAERYKKYDPLVIHGQLNEKDKFLERRNKVQSFNDLNSKHKLIILSPYTSASGLNLQFGSRRIVIFTQPADTMLFSQLIDRIYRITSTKDAIIYVCLIVKTFEILKYKRNRSRDEMNDFIYDSNMTSDKVEKLLNLKNYY